MADRSSRSCAGNGVAIPHLVPECGTSSGATPDALLREIQAE
jgi:hypothetical protein